MHVHLKIHGFETLDSIPDYWSLQDYQALLELCEVDDFPEMSLLETEDMLLMAFAEKEPEAAARLLLEYKLSDRLHANQIEQLSYEMLEDCMSEAHADISLHHCLFTMNELLNRAFDNGFPEAKATRIKFRLTVDGVKEASVNKEMIVKAFALCFKAGQIIARLYEEPLVYEVGFAEAESILWDLQSHGDHEYTVITSRYWMERADFTSLSAEGEIKGLRRPARQALIRIETTTVPASRLR